jgi:hypothetical protein
VIIKVDDGTGVAECWKFQEETDYDSAMNFIGVGDFASICGVLNMHNGYILFG